MTGAGGATTGAGGAATTGGGTTQTPGPHQPRCHQAKLGETETNSNPTVRTATVAVFFIVLLSPSTTAPQISAHHRSRRSVTRAGLPGFSDCFRAVSR